MASQLLEFRNKLREQQPPHVTFRHGILLSHLWFLNLPLHVWFISNIIFIPFFFLLLTLWRKWIWKTLKRQHSSPWIFVLIFSTIQSLKFTHKLLILSNRNGHIFFLVKLILKETDKQYIESETENYSSEKQATFWENSNPKQWMDI